jgi:O-antigen/teichoic acid export membrane protein
LKRSGGSTLALVLISQLAQSAAGVVGFLVIARIFGPTIFADYVFGTAFAGLFGCFAQNALREPVILSSGVGRQFFHAASFTISSTAALLCGVGGFLLQLYLPDRLIGTIVIALSVKIWIDGWVIVSYALRAKERNFALPAVASTVASFVSIGLLFLQINLGGTILSLPISQAAGSFVAFIIYAANERQAILVQFGALTNPVQNYMVSWLRVSMWQFIEYANGMFDRLYSGRVMPQLDQGLYGFARRLNDLFFEVLGGTVSSLSLPLLASATQDRDSLRAKYFDLVLIVGVALLGAIGGLFCLSDRFLVDVFGTKWVGAVAIYKVFLLLGVIQTYGYLQASLIRGVGENSLWTRYVGVQAVSNVLLVLIFASFGALTLAVAVVAKTYVIWVAHLSPVARILGTSITRYLLVLIRPLCAVVLPVLGVKFLHWMFPGMTSLIFYVVTITSYVACWSVSVGVICPQAVSVAIKILRRGSNPR